MNTVRNRRGFLGVAGGTQHFRDFGRVRKILDSRVAISAAQNPMRAGHVFRGTNGNIFPFLRLHPPLPVTREASFILL